MAWNWLTIELRPDDALIQPTIGPGGMTYKRAHSEVRRMIELLAKHDPRAVETARIWRRGAQDDAVALDVWTWALYQHDEPDPMPAARVWLADYAETIRATGLDVQIGTAPGEVPPEPAPVDLIEGRLGQAVMTGWIGETPEGRESPYLMLGTPDPRAPQTMPLVAEVLGIDPRPGMMTTKPRTARVALEGDRWISLITGGAPYTYRVSQEWEELARDQSRVVLVISYRPLPAGDLQPLVDELGDNLDDVVLALIPAR